MSKIVQKESGEVLAESYVEIAKYVAQTRAFPSILDGMKAVYRRMIYASKDIKHKTKSNIITAETMKYHPHGEAYGTLVSMACKFGSLPLFTSYGNFGGGGFGASASRYTSAVLNEVGRLMYLELVDYADYQEGDAGLDEPTYLPSLIPYALITSNKGMTVGLPTPNIPSFNLMDLINYCKCKITGDSCNYPKIDVGDCILDCTENDLLSLYETGHGQVWYKIKYQIIGNRIIVTDLPPKHRHWTAHRKIQEHIDSGAIDFLEDVDENGQKYEYVIQDESKITVQAVYDIFERYSKSKETYRMYFERNGSVYLCSLDYLISESQKYLRECAIRKFSREKEIVEHKLEVFKAIAMLKQSDELKHISEKSADYFKELIQSWGFDSGIANAVMSKSISYLTTSHDEEFTALLDSLDEISKLKDDPAQYLIGLYDRLIELVTPLYMSRRHSIYRDDVVDTSKIGFRFENGKLMFGLTRSRKFAKSNGMVYEFNENGKIAPKFVNKEVGVEIETDAKFAVSSENPKYAIGVVNDEIAVIPISKITKDTWYFKTRDVSITNAFLSDVDTVMFIDGNDRHTEVHLPDYVRTRFSLTSRVPGVLGAIKSIYPVGNDEDFKRY